MPGIIDFSILSLETANAAQLPLAADTLDIHLEMLAEWQAAHDVSENAAANVVQELRDKLTEYRFGRISQQELREYLLGIAHQHKAVIVQARTLAQAGWKPSQRFATNFDWLPVAGNKKTEQRAVSVSEGTSEKQAVPAFLQASGVDDVTASRKGLETFKRLRADFKKFPNADVFLERCRTDLALLPNLWVGRVDYLDNLPKLFWDEGQPAWAVPKVQLETAAFVERELDKETNYITNNTAPAFSVALEAEQSLLQAGPLDPAAAEQMADVLSVFARRGIYYASVGEGAEKRSASSSILYVLDVESRYKALGLTQKASAMQAFLSEVKVRFNISEDPLVWAIRVAKETFENNIHLLINAKKDPDRFQALLEILGPGYENFVHGAHTITPLFLDFFADQFRANEMNDVADHYTQRANTERALAKQLGLVVRDWPQNATGSKTP